MRTAHKRSSIVICSALLLIVLVANSVITRRRLAAQIDDEVWVSHTRQVLLGLAQTESLLKDAETGQRGFLYTGDSKYLAPYNRAIEQIDPSIEALSHLTADNPRQQARIPILKQLVVAKLSELDQTITLYKSGKLKEANALVRSDAGLVTMDRLHKLAEEMEQEETTLENSRVAAYERSIRITEVSIYLASVIGTFGLISLTFYILHTMELRERHAREISEREEWFRVTLTSLGDAVIATDELGKVSFLNPLAEQLTGWKLEYAKGKPIQDVFPIFNESTHDIVENPVEKVMKRGRVIGLANHTVLQKADGSLIAIEDSAAPIRDAEHRLIGVVLVFRDATLERKGRELLRKTDKLATAARIAATVAHEINNPLEAIGNLIYITQSTPGLPSEATELLLLAEHEVERISHITRQTLGFYRESNAPDEVALQTLIDSVLRIYSNKLSSKNITVQRDFAECPPVRGLAGELKQVVSNLISNAADAVSEFGTICLRLKTVEISGGQFVQIVIEDDGPGIGAEQRERIFEPFFTTKKDVGTGLGLWVAKEIIERHRGTIEVYSQRDQTLPGAVFEIRLPSAADFAGRAHK